MEHVQNLEEIVIPLIVSGVPGKFRNTRITRDTHLQKELGLDSLGLLALVFRFEEKFSLDLSKLKIEINVAKLRTVSDVIKAAEEILEKARTVQHA